MYKSFRKNNSYVTLKPVIFLYYDIGMISQSDFIIIVICLSIMTSKLFKVDLLCKNHLYKGYKHSCVVTVCEYNQFIMVKKYF